MIFDTSCFKSFLAVDHTNILDYLNKKKIINQNAAHLHREEAAVTNSLLSSTEFPPERRLCIAKSDLCPKQLLREEWQGRMQMKWGRAI